jgi:hypothetical protein
MIAMNAGSLPATAPLPVPDKPTLDGLEEKWTNVWEMGRVVQV